MYFERRWARLRSDGSTTNRVVELDGRVVGHIASFDLEGHREVTYWIGREDWGRGIATRAPGGRDQHHPRNLGDLYVPGVRQGLPAGDLGS